MKTITIEKRISSKDNQYIDNYFSEVANYQILSDKEEKDLARKYREENDEKAKEKLVNCNLRFVISVAKSYQTTGMPLSELISEGNVGLLKAIEKFDERKGFKFISYAVWWIKQSILFSLSQNYGMIRPPVNRYNLLSKINNFIDVFYKKNNQKPEKEIILEEFNISSQQYEEIMEMSQPQSYFYDKVSQTDDDENFRVIDSISSDFFEETDHFVREKAKNETLSAAFSTLNKREKDVVEVLFGFKNNYTINDLEEKYNISKTRIDQIKKDALKKIRSIKGVEKMKEIL